MSRNLWSKNAHADTLGRVLLSRDHPPNLFGLSTTDLTQFLNLNSASSEAGAQTRNTFKVVPYAGELDDICLGSPLRYNQVFCLQSVCNPDLYLASDSIRKLNTLSNIAYGRNEVFLVDKKSRVS